MGSKQHHVLRIYARNKMLAIIDQEARTLSKEQAINAEVAIFNVTLRRAMGLNHKCFWNNPTFRKMYKYRLIQVLFALQRYPKLREEIAAGTTLGEEIPQLSPFEIMKRYEFERWNKLQLASDLRYNKIIKALEKKDDKEERVGMQRCGRCKSYRTDYTQAQTRSADEPLTTFFTCLDCDHHWKC